MRFVCFFACIASCLSISRAFNVTVGTPTQCGPLNISWTGGQAPFQILLTPSLKPYQNVSVPASTFSNGVGSYSIPQLALSAGTVFLLTMSDATGFGSGGTTIELTVGNSGNNDCIIQNLSPTFTFDVDPTPSPMTQCGQFTITVNGTAVLPITIVQLIPGGQPAVFYSNNETFTSVVDVKGETQLMYFVTDSTGKQGGTSESYGVIGSSNFSCISAVSPSSTVGILATATTTSSPSSSSSSSPSSSNVALIAGVVVGCVAVLTALFIFGVCLWRKRRASRFLPPTKSYFRVQNTDEIGLYSDSPPLVSPYPVSYLGPSIRPGSQPSTINTESATYEDIQMNPPIAFNQTQNIRQSPDTDSSTIHGNQFMASTSTQRAYRHPGQIIVHTDAGDIVPDHNCLIELPPQYSEHRGTRAFESESAS
ncbi:uncharacterized protein EDB93DRAFT_1091097 [Suillus bovinus]|uniref:uncharacterized protein n=1 Tax=Suillus bovinus TaxID=48563 RepID=UPI001B865F68|nr:uncharacterized protein EDB93DRAFT_1091097 [Suillus bovinus]KAG2137614.1 hypothetical protein EDB93DRAFT_1091097 [Suillus bovinus]